MNAVYAANSATTAGGFDVDADGDGFLDDCLSVHQIYARMTERGWEILDRLNFVLEESE